MLNLNLFFRLLGSSNNQHHLKAGPSSFVLLAGARTIAQAHADSVSGVLGVKRFFFTFKKNI
jgi:hypothetical protein